jgi:predicted AAA+ superfamily ATPase
MHRRHLHQSLTRALDDARVVLLNGAREVGKSTLAKQLAQERGGRYLTLDDPAVAELARNDPAALLRGTSELIVIDEAQRIADALPALWRDAASRPAPGPLLFTGSARMWPDDAQASSALEVTTLEPLSQAEIEGSAHNLVDALFDPTPWQPGRVPTDRAELARRVCGGGFPQALACADAAQRADWFNAYLAAVLQRDAPEIARIESLHELPRLVALLADRSSALLNMAEVSRAAGIAHSTLRRYLAMLEALFIVRLLPAWGPEDGKRFVKAPKLHLLDAGLAAHLQGHGDPADLAWAARLAPLLETFVVQELRKHLAWAATRATAWHYRTTSGKEVDLVLEADDGRVVGVDVRASAGVVAGDFGGLKDLAETCGDRFVRGVVFHVGDALAALDDGLWALPLGVLWAR